MSHIVTIKTEVRDAAAVRAACRRMGLAEPAQGTEKLFGSEVTGLAVQLPDWQYSVVCDTATGQLKYDNFQGRWGDQKHLDRFLQCSPSDDSGGNAGPEEQPGQRQYGAQKRVRRPQDDPNDQEAAYRASTGRGSALSPCDTDQDSNTRPGRRPGSATRANRRRTVRSSKLRKRP